VSRLPCTPTFRTSLNPPAVEPFESIFLSSQCRNINNLQRSLGRPLPVLRTHARRPALRSTAVFGSAIPGPGVGANCLIRLDGADLLPREFGGANTYAGRILPGTRQEVTGKRGARRPQGGRGPPALRLAFVLHGFRPVPSLVPVQGLIQSPPKESVRSRSGVCPGLRYK